MIISVSCNHSWVGTVRSRLGHYRWHQLSAPCLSYWVQRGIPSDTMEGRSSMGSWYMPHFLMTVSVPPYRLTNFRAVFPSLGQNKARGQLGKMQRLVLWLVAHCDNRIAYNADTRMLSHSSFPLLFRPFTSISHECPAHQISSVVCNFLDERRRT